MLRRTNKTNRYALVGILVLTVFCVGAFLSSSFVEAIDDVVVDKINVLVPISCSLTSTNTTHIDTINPGTYKSDIGTTTLKAYCNDGNGFAIYAIGYTGQEYGETDLVGMGTNLSIPTSVHSNGDSASSWAMKLTATSGTYTPIIAGSSSDSERQSGDTDYSGYAEVPDTYTRVAYRNSATDTIDLTNPVGSTLTTTYEAYISSTQPVDTYHGKVKYTLVHPATNVPNEPHNCASNSICYWPNAGDMTVNGVGVEDRMGDQSITSSNTSAVLWASNFKREGYGFAGWSDAYDWVVNVGSESNPDAHIYGPNETITFTAGQYNGTNKGLSLYAVWVPSAGFLQGWTGCSNLSIGQVTALTDIRDSDTYAVAKLADGNCWMIENLRLDYDADMDPSLSQGFRSYSGSGANYGSFIGLAKPETANFFNYTVANSLYSVDGSTTINIGSSSASYPNYRMPRYRNDNTNTDSTININVNTNDMTGINQNIYSYGNYYTWAAAMANTYSYVNTNIDSDGFTISEAVGTSICPADWKLPYGRGTNKGVETGGFYNLNYMINSNSNVTDSTASNKLRAYPNNYLYSGYVSDSSINNRGSIGSYWTSTALNFTYSYSARIQNSSINPGTYSSYSKYHGLSVRCLVGS